MKKLHNIELKVNTSNGINGNPDRYEIGKDGIGGRGRVQFVGTKVSEIVLKSAAKEWFWVPTLV